MLINHLTQNPQPPFYTLKKTKDLSQQQTLHTNRAKFKADSTAEKISLTGNLYAGSKQFVLYS